MNQIFLTAVAVVAILAGLMFAFWLGMKYAFLTVYAAARNPDASPIHRKLHDKIAVLMLMRRPGEKP